MSMRLALKFGILLTVTGCAVSKSSAQNPKAKAETGIEPAAVLQTPRSVHKASTQKSAQKTVVPSKKPVERLVLTDAQWRARLTPAQFRILRRKGTERAFSGPLLNNQRTGIYRCSGCSAPLFRSETKFKSGTGWPSFSDTVPGQVKRVTDSSHGMRRTEIVCARCNGHLGHVFKDGPKPTGERHCVNSVALKFEESLVP
jgi:peptide-methionine (R)-S-oxide reductase